MRRDVRKRTRSWCAHATVAPGRPGVPNAWPLQRHSVMARRSCSGSLAWRRGLLQGGGEAGCVPTAPCSVTSFPAARPATHLRLPRHPNHRRPATQKHESRFEPVQPPGPGQRTGSRSPPAHIEFAVARAPQRGRGWLQEACKTIQRRWRKARRPGRRARGMRAVELHEWRRGDVAQVAGRDPAQGRCCLRSIADTVAVVR